MKRNWLRKIVGGISFTSALFVFQACYGTPQDFGFDLFIEGQVKSASTGLPVQGIKVAVGENLQYQYTDEHGRFAFYTQLQESVLLRFQDVDSIQNGVYQPKDTLLTGFDEKMQTVQVNVELAEIP